MTLGNINGVPIDSILQRISDSRLREAYRSALESFNAEHPLLLENPEALALYLNPHAATYSQGIGYQSMVEQVAFGRLHADQYVAAAYLLRAIASRHQVSDGLFRINPLRAEHLILARHQEASLEALRRVSTRNEVEMLTALRDVEGLGDGVLEYLRYFENLPPESREVWSRLEAHEDHGVRTNFLSLRSRMEFIHDFAENYYRNYAAALGVFEAGEAKPEMILQSSASLQNEEPPCAPQDPSCND